jgi:phosphomevalonate kinase
MTRAAHAPGKLFLTGEWAVLRGAPAVVAAVDRRARVTVEPGAGEGVEIESLAEGRRERVLDVAGAPLPPGDAGMVLAAMRERGGPPRPLRVVVDSRAFLVGERKLGLGRSAATLVAAVAALGARDSATVVLRRALQANQLFQEGQGSGADVAAAVHGGVIEVRRASDGLLAGPRTLPAGLHLVAGWTGTSAHTPPMLARFTAAPLPAVFAELTAAATDAADAVARGDAAALLAAVERSATLLERLGAALDLPLVTPELARLVRAANRAGAVAKPSGAGGGDCGIAFATSAAQATAVQAAWRDAGILPLAVRIDPEGVAHA